MRLNVVFGGRKKDHLARLGEGGGGLRLTGNARLKYFFVDVVP